MVDDRVHGSLAPCGRPASRGVAHDPVWLPTQMAWLIVLNSP